jgi:hypothetical protein
VIVFVVLVAVASLSTIFAQATHQDTKDGNDVRGNLDIREVKRLGQTPTPGWKINVSSANSERVLRDRGFFLVYLDTFGDSQFDYYALVSSDGSKMLAKLWRDRLNRPDINLGKLSVWRADKLSVSVQVPLSKVNTGGKERLTYRWFVKTLFTGEQCHRVCIDRAPNKNALTESNGKPSPSPTNTDDPGLTESPEPSVTPGLSPSPDETP